MNFEIKKISETWQLISQALMVARGDLGVELELERVPFAQKLLIRTGESDQQMAKIFIDISVLTQVSELIIVIMGYSLIMG